MGNKRAVKIRRKKMRTLTRKEVLIRFCLLCSLVFGIVFLSNLFATSAHAKTPAFSKNYNVYYDEDAEDYEEFSYDFHMSKGKIQLFYITMSRYDGKAFTGKESLSFTLYKEEYNDLYEDLDDKQLFSNDISIPKGFPSYDYFIYLDQDYRIEPGNYTISMSSDDDIKGNVKGYYYSNYTESLSLPKTIKMKTDQEKSIKLSNIVPSGSAMILDWKSSNKNLLVGSSPQNHELSLLAKKAGKYTVTGKLQNNKIVKTTVIVKDPPPALNYTSFDIEAGYKDKIKLFYSKGKIKWKSTNKKVATVNSKGVIKAVSKGKCKIYCKYKGKKYTAKIKVTRGIPWFEGLLNSYNTRNNYFSVTIKNKNKKKLTIYPTNAKAIEDDYKSFDRTLRIKGGKAVVIKPGKSKKIKFMVRGSVTWYDEDDFYVYFDFKYDGKKYRGRTWTEGSAYKKGKKWYGSW